VHCAENGAEALALLHAERPAAILLDLSMPVMSGWELLEALQGRHDLREIPVVVLSAMRGPAGVEQLNKPVSLEELLATLERVCRAARAVAGLS
jgi:CheY-like chemotaxis protein